MLNKVAYLWERRRVLKNMAGNYFSWLLNEAGRKNADPELPTIICVRRTARTRIHNHALSLGKVGVQTILIAHAYDYHYQKETFSEIHPWLHIKQIPGLINKLQRRLNIIAVISSHQPAAQTEVLLEMKRDFPLLIDHHDSAWSQVYFQGTTDIPESGAWLSQSEVASEEKCYRSVDGVIARNGELIELFEENQVKTPVKVFEDRCYRPSFQPVPEHGRPKSGQWSIAYAGAVFSGNEDPRNSHPQLVAYGDTFNRANVHFHIYPSPLHEYSYPDYHAEAARNPFFHIHRSVGYRQIQRTLSAYDLGLINIETPAAFTLFSSKHFQYHIHAKFHAYMEAGLPIIVPACFKREAEIVHEWGIGIVFEKFHDINLAELLDGANIHSMRQSICRAREAWAAENQGEDLLAFISMCS